MVSDEVVEKNIENGDFTANIDYVNARIFATMNAGFIPLFSNRDALTTSYARESLNFYKSISHVIRENYIANTIAEGGVLDILELESKDFYDLAEDISIDVVKSVPAIAEKSFKTNNINTAMLERTIGNFYCVVLAELYLLSAAVSHCEGDYAKTLARLFDAQDGAIMFRVNMLGLKTGDNPLKEFAKKAADVRHKEDRELKQESINYYLENKNDFPNKEDAAFYISKNITPLKQSTIRKHLRNI